MRWIREVESDTATHSSLRKLGRGFESLDQKLAAALSSMSHDEIGRHITQAAEEAAQNDEILRGRQALLIVYKHYAFNAHLGSAYSIVDLVNVTWKGDNNIERFLDEWNSVLVAADSVKDVNAIEQLFLRQVRKSAVLQQDVSYYERLPPGHLDRIYGFLVAAARRYLERERLGRNRREVEHAFP